MTNYSTVSIYNRYYEVNEMDLTVAKTKTKIKNTGMTYVSIFGLTLLLGLVKIYDTSLCFVLPMLVVSFMCGYRHIIMYMTALLLVSYISYDNYMLLLVSITRAKYLLLTNFKYIITCIIITLVIETNNSI